MKKRDLLVIAIGVVILIVLFLAPKESTTRVPNDATHKEVYALVHSAGKKAAEKQCQTCHNPQGVPFPKNHPPKFRCLFCHKLQQ